MTYTETRQDLTDSPALPVAVRAARAMHRAGQDDPEARRLRRAVREAVSHPDVWVHAAPEPTDRSAEARAHRRAMRAAHQALRVLLDYAGGAFACEAHDVAGTCDPECLALASLMSAPDYSTPEDPTGCTYVPADYLEPTHHLALVASTVVWERTSTERPCFACTHQHDPASPGSCWEAACLPGCQACAR